jgi:hypothetical protein
MIKMEMDISEARKQYPETSNEHRDVLFAQCFCQKKWRDF